MRIVINGCTVCMVKAERNSLIRRKEEEDLWLFTLHWLPGGRSCVFASACMFERFWPICDCCQAWALMPVWVNGAWQSRGSNNRLQRVRGAFSTSKHTDRAAHWCQIRRRTTHADQQLNEGHRNWSAAVSSLFPGMDVCFMLIARQNLPVKSFWV